ncbi:uncharacterized protein G2W53_029241 [Senna tora]|uniref:Uncharacterized protein n=1 Tax=Senna tora TaxID=362788 RepID=A0A834WAH2_9FABA|nr:uncharacterized protein G2W53_029241 [Senna tora]
MGEDQNGETRQHGGSRCTRSQMSTATPTATETSQPSDLARQGKEKCVNKGIMVISYLSTVKPRVST